MTPEIPPTTTSATGPLYAHTPNQSGAWHLLAEHLQGTAALARGFAEAMGAEAAQLAYYAGLWHDLGKSHPRFQQYLRDQHQGIGRKGEGRDHKGAGCVHVEPTCDWLAFLIAGHHGGLLSQADVRAKLENWRGPASHVPDALNHARAALGPLLDPPAEPLPLPPGVQTSREVELFLRLLFACLVDADFLDTEAHFDPERTERRAASGVTREHWERFAADQEALIARSGAAAAASAGTAQEVHGVRAAVYRAAVAAAGQPPGFFRLTVPTGGGKTRVGLAFGLRHALQHGLRRVIFAVPYTSITEQTAQTYRGIFGEGSGVVLEHHSAVAGDEDAENPPQAELWRRLAAENWDSPVIVTTTVQLFESLLGKNTSACRKLHNLVGSVIVLDEAQTLPARLLTPLLDVLRELVRRYRVSVVFCTATQPAFEAVPGFEEIARATEIAPDPPRLFAALKRVRYDWPAPSSTLTGEEVAELMRQEIQALAIVNTRKAALALLDALDDPEAVHLSTLLCGAHRRDALAAVRERLRRGRPCRLVATQVVEAGVDLDFPLVLRALGPLDSVVQAAGRCNREGLLGREGGRLVVFEPADGGMPPDAYRVGADQTRLLLADGAPDADDPATVQRYYRLLFGILRGGADGPRVQALRASLDYPAVAVEARLIKDDTVPVVVRYRGAEGDDDRVDALLERLRRPRPGFSRFLLRELQPYVVNVRRREAAEYERQRLMQEVMPGLGVREWLGRYDPVRGLVPRLEIDADRLVV